MALTAALAANALVDLATIEGELDLASDDGPIDSAIIRLINVASQTIETYCSRKFAVGSWVDLIGVPGTNRGRIMVKNPPIWQAPYVQAWPFTPSMPAGSAPNPTGAPMQITNSNDEGDPATANDPVNGEGQSMAFGTDYYLEDPAAGFIFRQARWVTSALHRDGITQDWDPDAVEADYQAAYVGGYVTVPQLNAALEAWPDAGAAVKLLTLLTPVSQPSQVWVAGTTAATGAEEPDWPAAPSIGASLQDGGVVWTFIGAPMALGAQPTNQDGMQLPADLEQAAIDLVVTNYRRRGQSLEQTAEKFMQASQTYTTGARGRILMSEAVSETLNRYRLIQMGG